MGRNFYTFSPVTAYENSAAGLRHTGTCNMAFGDGHVAGLKKNDLKERGFTVAVENDVLKTSLSRSCCAACWAFRCRVPNF